MKDLIAQLKRKWTKRVDDLDLKERKFSFIKSRKLIRRELSNSMQNETAIGIYTDAFGEGMFLCCVVDIFSMDSDEIVVLKPYDMNGILLQRNQLSLAEIRCVCPTESKYYNPLWQKV